MISIQNIIKENHMFVNVWFNCILENAKKKKKKNQFREQKAFSLEFLRINCKLHLESLRGFKFYILKF